MSSLFQQKFMAKNPTKGFTMDQLEKSSKKAEKQMKKSAAILPQVEGPGNPDYESKDEQKFAGDDTYTYKKKDDSPLNGAYESGADSMVYVSNAPAFSKLQTQINASTKEAIYGLAKDKKDEETSDTFNSFSFKPKNLSSKYKATK
jgi:hypothetical protein